MQNLYIVLFSHHNKIDGHVKLFNNIDFKRNNNFKVVPSSPKIEAFKNIVFNLKAI